jgi:hypothetical protein
MMNKRYYPWSCPRCRASGRFKHVENATEQQLAQAYSLAHAQHSPECHAAGLAAQHILRTQVPEDLTPREKHILISVRIKRKIMADALRDMRMVVPAPPIAETTTWADWLAAVAVRNSSEAWNEWVARVSMKRTGLRKQFEETRTLRRGYAFT